MQGETLNPWACKTPGRELPNSLMSTTTSPARFLALARSPPAFLVMALFAVPPEPKGSSGTAVPRGSPRPPWGLSTTALPSSEIGHIITAFCWIRDLKTFLSLSTAAQNFCCSRLSA